MARRIIKHWSNVDAKKELTIINQAINRDEEILESKSKFIENLIKQEEDINSRILWLKEEENKLLVVVDTLKKNNQAEMILLNNEKLELNTKLDIIKKNIEDWDNKLAEIQEIHKNRLNWLENEYKVKQSEVYNDIKKEQEVLESINNDIQKQVKEKEKLLETNDKLKIQIEDNKNILNSLKKDIVDQEKYMDEIDRLNKSVLDINKDIALLNNVLSKMQSEKDKLNLDKTNLSEEISKLEEEKNTKLQYILDLKNREDNLREKELYIKNKFQEAGLNYN
jgi:hypothetical protein